ncbi:hypothetical protein PMIN01_12193 [Paraphaeosphaeria minitans]|uniref:Uncharacterized protein n=1 Tax=Paraphaeosphaeria minitans TaxID=565426 RepID=A0A9P6G891_9PLEO|nr:hypothetical protein PMIN01_12193 [Paraphaeosphaeria minitans]
MWVICCLSHEAPTPSEKEPLLRSYVSQQYFSRSQPTIAKPQDSVELPPSSQRCELRLPPPPPPPSPSPPPQALPAGPIPAHLVFFTDKPTLKDDIVINVLEYGIAIKDSLEYKSRSAVLLYSTLLPAAKSDVEKQQSNQQQHPICRNAARVSMIECVALLGVSISAKWCFDPCYVLFLIVTTISSRMYVGVKYYKNHGLNAMNDAKDEAVAARKASSASSAHVHEAGISLASIPSSQRSGDTNGGNGLQVHVRTDTRTTSEPASVQTGVEAPSLPSASPLIVLPASPPLTPTLSRDGSLVS